VTPNAAVERETAARRWAVPAAALGGLLPFAAFIAPRLIFGAENPKNRGAQLFSYNDHVATLNLSAIVGGLGYLAIALALWHLLGAVRARRPEFPVLIGMLAVGGAALTAIVSTASTLATGHAASAFASSPNPTYQRASDLLGTGLLQIVQGLGLLAGFIFGAGLVALSLNAMRIGLLPRFMGYVGIFAGIFTALPIVPAPVLLCFWLGAVAYLFAGRWPSGLPPAWRTGRAEPWPSLQEARERGGDARGRGAPAPAPEPVAATAPQAPRDPGGARRKRKKRR
jgi:hypothetical protein